jgi:polar amino acid transport system substrate-binding protein
MQKRFLTGVPLRRLYAAGLRSAVLGAVLAAGLGVPMKAEAAAPVACAALQEKYPDWKGKTLVNAINPHTPGYESIDPKDPDKYVGFDIDLGEAIGECLGFKLTYKAVTFAALLTTLAAGQADIVISDIYATEERAKAGDFITYSRVFDGVLVAKGNPKKIDGINMSMCGAAAAENTGSRPWCRSAKRQASRSRPSSSMTTMPTVFRRSSPAARTPTSTTSIRSTTL